MQHDPEPQRTPRLWELLLPLAFSVSGLVAWCAWVVTDSWWLGACAVIAALLARVTDPYDTARNGDHAAPPPQDLR